MTKIIIIFIWIVIALYIGYCNGFVERKDKQEHEMRQKALKITTEELKALEQEDKEILMIRKFDYEEKEINKWLKEHYDREITMSNNDENDWEMLIKYEINIWQWEDDDEIGVELTLYEPDEDGNYQRHNSFDISEEVNRMLKETDNGIVACVIIILENKEDEVFGYGMGR